MAFISMLMNLKNSRLKNILWELVWIGINTNIIVLISTFKLSNINSIGYGSLLSKVNIQYYTLYTLDGEKRCQLDTCTLVRRCFFSGVFAPPFGVELTMYVSPPMAHPVGQLVISLLELHKYSVGKWATVNQ